jgi:hypothetical protein
MSLPSYADPPFAAPADSYLIRKIGAKAKAHIWNGNDTLCRMWSTGGLKRSRFEVRQDRGAHEVCHMCVEASEAQ